MFTFRVAKEKLKADPFDGESGALLPRSEREDVDVRLEF
jgi:hypothetical protein